MKSIKKGLLLSVTLFTLASCNKSNPVNSPGGEQILPLNMGNTWLMQYTVYDTTGATQGTTYDTTSVTMDTVLAGETWYHIATKISSGPLFYTNKSDGLWEMTLGSSIAPTLLYKYPANVGDNWSVQMDASTNYQVSLQSTGASVSVPKGNYACYDYRMLDNSQPVEEVYLNPGLGIVAIDIYASTNSGRSYRVAHGELVSVSLK